MVLATKESAGVPFLLNEWQYARTDIIGHVCHVETQVASNLRGLAVYMPRALDNPIRCLLAIARQQIKCYFLVFCVFQQMSGVRDPL